MGYAVKQDLIDRFGEKELRELTDRVNRPPTTIDETVVGRALADATALIDGYIAKKYNLPLATVPEILIKTTSDVARYYLHGKAADKDSPVTAAYNQAVAWLKDVAKGLIQLDDGGETPEPAGGGAIKTSAPNRVFTRTSLRSF
jgi:phage gp36-like protein